MPLAVKRGLKIKSPQKQSKEGLKSSRQLSSLKLPAFNSAASSQIDVLQSVKNYLIQDYFEPIPKKDNGRATAYIVFILDCSSSMAVQQQMGYVKGLMEQTIKKQRYRKIHYAMVTLDNGSAAIAQPFTGKPHLITQLNKNLKTRGKTNLGAAFVKAHSLIRTLDKRQVQLFTFTDGKANTGQHGSQDPFHYALDCYRRYLGKNIRSTIIDTERGLVKLGKAKELAQKLGLRYERIG